MAVKTLIDILLADAATIALVGNRITPLTRPQDLQLPAITAQRISVVPQNSLRGFANLDANRVQLDCWADTYAGARALAAACRTAINAAGHVCVSEVDDFEIETRTFRVIQDYSVWL